MFESEFHLRMRSLVVLTRMGTVVEYTMLFWERLDHVLRLDSGLSIKCFIHPYIDGLRKDIEAVVLSQSPSSIARIREEEVMKDGNGCQGAWRWLRPWGSQSHVYWARPLSNLPNWFFLHSLALFGGWCWLPKAPIENMVVACRDGFGGDKLKRGYMK